MKPDFKGLGKSLVFILLETVVIALFPFAWSYEKCAGYKCKKVEAPKA
jgi:hypothetical protein